MRTDDTKITHQKDQQEQEDDKEDDEEAATAATREGNDCVGPICVFLVLVC